MEFLGSVWRYVRGFKIVRRNADPAEPRAIVRGKGRKITVTVEVEGDG